MADGSADLSTIPPESSGTDGWERVLRAVSVSSVAVLALLALTGFLGVRTGTASNSANGYTISVTHASVTRPGLATPFSISIATDDGSPLPAQVTMRVDSGYLEMFDENGLDPTPVTSFSTAKWTLWTFEVPRDEHELNVSFDARLEPAVQWGRTGSVVAEIDGNEVVTVEFRTWVMP